MMPTDAEIEDLRRELRYHADADIPAAVRKWLAPIIAAEVERAVAERTGPLAEACREFVDLLDRPEGCQLDSWVRARIAARDALEAGGRAEPPPAAGAGAVTGEVIDYGHWGDLGRLMCRLTIQHEAGPKWDRGARVAVVPLADAETGGPPP
jgi:hypothetical protein